MGGIAGFGTSFSWNSNIVAKLNNIGGFKFSVDTKDGTTHQSTGGFEEIILTIIRTGDIAISGFFDPTDATGQLAMFADFAVKQKRTMGIAWPSITGSAFSCTGAITEIAVGDAPTDDGLPFSANIKIDGVPSFTTAASNNLSALAITTATLYPTFAAGAYDYTAVSTGASVTVTPTAAAGTITVNGNVVASTVPSGAISLGSSGTVTVITVVVAETAKAPKTYTIRIAKTA